MSYLDLLQQAIAALEAQRSTLGDAVVDASLAALRRGPFVPPIEVREDQRKLVTVLFADLAGFTSLSDHLDPEDVRELQDAYFAAITPPILANGGTVEKYVGDAILAVFGVPDNREDDAVRAVYAALEMQQAIGVLNAHLAASHRGAANGLRLALRIGLHTGLVISSTGEGQGMLLVSGDSVNLAARVQEMAVPGAVFITDATQRLVASQFITHPLGPIHIRGKADPVSVHQVEGILPAVERLPRIASPLVGRRAELRLMRDRVEQLRAGKGGVILVGGEAGIGKSRLVAEVRKGVAPSPSGVWPAQDRGVRWVESRCVSSKVAPPYAPWIDSLRTIFGIKRDATPHEVSAGVQAWLNEMVGGRAKDLFTSLAPMFGIPQEELPLASSQPADQQRRMLAAAVEAVLAAATQEGPLILVCEDMHWADPSSLDLWEHMLALAARAPILLIGVVRVEAGPVAQRLIRIVQIAQTGSLIELQPLSAEQCERLVRNLTDADVLPQKVVYRILAQAEGNPFFVEEILRALVDSGMLARPSESGPWHASREIEEIAIPDTVLGVLMARIDRLQRDTRRVLQLASVVGRVFSHPVLAAISENTQDLEHHLEILQQEELIRERRSDSNTREFIFKHELTREAAYSCILKRQRRVFHRRAAEAFERLYPDHQDELLGVLAHHWERTDEPARAIDPLLRAGDLARLAYARQEAIDAYERALTLQKEHGDDEGAARTLLRMGMVHSAAFDFGRASKAYAQSFSLWKRLPPAHQQANDLPPAPHPFRLMWGLEPKDWDANPTFDYEIPLFSGLLEAGRSLDLEAVPDVASDWELLDGGRTYLFHLRADVQWSDGQPVTADDFEFAWKRLLDPAVPPMNARRRALDTSSGLRSVDILHDLRGARAYHQGETSDPSALGVRAIDPVTLCVELERPVVSFLHVMAHPAAFPVPRHCVERYGDAWCEADKIVGNGPFVLKRWIPRERVDLARNSRYHGRAGGNIREVELLCLPYPTAWTARLELYEADQLDFLNISNWPREAFELVQERHPREVIRAPSLHTTAECINVRRYPFDDRRVRQAYAHVVDRRGIVQIVQGDAIDVATGGYVPPAMVGHSPQIGLKHDPEKARRLLAAAGFPGGQGFPEIEYLTMMTPSVRGALPYWQQALKAVLGISMRFRVVNWMEYFDTLLHDPPHIGIMTWSADTPDPDNFLRVGYRHIQRYFGWQHELYERLVEQAGQEIDSVARIGLYRQADAILVREAAIVPFIHNPAIYLAKPWLKHFAPSHLTGTSVWNSLRDVVIVSH